MIEMDDLVDGYARNLSILQRQTAGLTHADSLIQPPVRGNCLNWVVGHIASSRGRILAVLGEEPVLSEEQTARYGRNSAPVLGDTEDVLLLPMLMDALVRAQGRIAAALGRATPESLARETQFGPATMTVARAVLTNYFHDTYHTGQAELLRQLAGPNDHVL